MRFIETLERCLGRATGEKVVLKKIFEPMKPGDVPVTYASTDRLVKAIRFRPETPIEEGLQSFANWFVDYYNIKERTEDPEAAEEKG